MDSTLPNKGIHIDGVWVTWTGRDISQASDKEIDRIRRIVERESDADYGRELEQITIESHYVDRDSVRYVTSTSVMWHAVDEEQPAHEDRDLDA